jgi:hypothetical protein
MKLDSVHALDIPLFQEAIHREPDVVTILPQEFKSPTRILSNRHHQIDKNILWHSRDFSDPMK